MLQAMYVYVSPLQDFDFQGAIFSKVRFVIPNDSEESHEINEMLPTSA